MLEDKLNEISQYVEMDRDLLLEKGVEAFLRERKRELMIERYELLSRHEVSNLEELRKKIETGDVKEHPSWEDLITLENPNETLSHHR
ncbi:hypothetical protein KGY79_12140 [Candidatus Bipolaricaulota bacterium]|nr:hypothetical protein [Candidatus Bipolaricaulota bacterium]